MIKIAYIYPDILPTQKARGIQIVNTCLELSKYAKIDLWIENKSKSQEDIINYYKKDNIYKINDNFKIKYAPRFIWRFKLTSLFYKKLKKEFLKNPPDIIITRNLQIIDKLYSLKIPLILEAHECFKDKPNVKKKVIRLEKKVYEKVNAIAFLNSLLKKRIEREYNINAIFSIIPSGTDINLYKDKKINNKKLKDYIYIGSSYYKWKGLNILLKALKYIPSSYKIHIIGDMKNLSLKEDINNKIKFYGYIPPYKVKNLLQNFHVGVIPNTSETLISKYYTSPLKLLEYMSAKIGIIASDLPSIREIVDEESAELVPPEDPQKLALSIIKLLEDPEERVKKIQNAWKRVQEYSWEKRAQKILDLIKRVIENC